MDGISQWEHMMAGTNGRADDLHLSEKAVLRWPYKLVIGEQPYSVRWSSQVMITSSTTATSYPGF